MVDLVRELVTVVGAEHCRAPAPAGADWLGRARAPVLAGVAPETVEDTSAVLRLCAAARAAVVPVGGDTGLVGGTLPQVGDRPVVLLATTRLRGIDVDPGAGTVLAGAGESLAAVQRAAAAAGWVYGVDLAARDSATIGGTVATNAGGVHVCAFGTTRAQLLGVTAVLADGSIVRDLRGLPKDNTGIDLRDLWCGSEGTLAVLTTVLLRLHRAPQRVACIAAAVPDLAAGLALSRQLEEAGRLLATEAVDGRSWRAAAAGMGLRDPVRPGEDGFVVLVEVMDADADAVAAAAPPEVVVATDQPARRALWAAREQQTEWWVRRAGNLGATRLAKFDIAVPLRDVDSVLHAVGQELAAAAVADWGVFGHLREGSLHVQAAITSDSGAVDDAVYRLVAQAGGSISAEHGIGRDKVGLLPLCRSSAERSAARAVKDALDPGDVLNPGAVFGD